MTTALPREIVLASQSPRRLELARAAGWRVTVMPPADAVEAAAAARGPEETLADHVVRLALVKARAVAATMAAATILACDTLSEVDGEALGKPRDRADARRMLQRLSGRTHRVLTGVCLWDHPGFPPETTAVESILTLPPLDATFIEGYLDTGLWQGKAGACGFQDGHVPLQLVTGSSSNVVGLPLEAVGEMLERLDERRRASDRRRTHGG